MSEVDPKPTPAKKDESPRDKRGAGPGGSPRRRVIEPIPSLEREQYYGRGPSMRELDDEIAGELEASLGGLSVNELFVADSSARAQQAASGTQQARKQGRVLSVHGKDIFVDVPGGRSQGVLSREQFPDGAPAPGTLVEFEIEGYDGANGLLILTRRGAAVVADWASVSEGMTVEARVTETNKGGLAVEINGIRGFMPISQVDLYRVENAEQFVNQKLLCIVTEVDREERNLVVSRRALLEKQRDEQREKTWQELAVNQVHTGIVRSVKPFGAFVDIGGVDGLLPVHEMSWQRVADPAQILQPGQTIKVIVLKIDPETRKVGLGLKQLEASPWDTIQNQFSVGQTLQGKVTRTAEYGAFVELAPGLEGLVHVSEIAHQRVRRVVDYVKPDQVVQVKILSIDPEQKRISLSLKSAEAPEEADAEEGDEKTAEKPQRPRNIPLRGGIGQESFKLEMPEQE